MNKFYRKSQKARSSNKNYWIITILIYCICNYCLLNIQYEVAAMDVRIYLVNVWIGVDIHISCTGSSKMEELDLSESIEIGIEEKVTHPVDVYLLCFVACVARHDDVFATDLFERKSGRTTNAASTFRSGLSGQYDWSASNKGKRIQECPQHVSGRICVDSAICNRSVNWAYAGARRIGRTRENTYSSILYQWYFVIVVKNSKRRNWNETNSIEKGWLKPTFPALYRSTSTILFDINYRMNTCCLYLYSIPHPCCMLNWATTEFGKSIQGISDKSYYYKAVVVY